MGRPEQLNIINTCMKIDSSHPCYVHYIYVHNIYKCILFCHAFAFKYCITFLLNESYFEIIVINSN